MEKGVELVESEFSVYLLLFVVLAENVHFQTDRALAVVLDETVSSRNYNLNKLYFRICSRSSAASRSALASGVPSSFSPACFLAPL